MSSELDEIWALYADDGAHSLDLAEQSLLSLQENPAGTGQIAALFRAIHTFKGNARVLGLATIEKCAHAAEDLIGIVRDENIPLDPELLALLLEASDALRELMNQSLARRADPDPEWSRALVERIQDKIQRCRAEQRGEAAAPEEPEAIVFEHPQENTLQMDEGYRKIFFEMAQEALAEARTALELAEAGQAPDTGMLLATFEHLRFAAGQMELQGWMEPLSAFLHSGETTEGSLRQLVAHMEALMQAPPAGEAARSAIEVAVEPIYAYGRQEEEAFAEAPPVLPLPEELEFAPDAFAAGGEASAQSQGAFQDLKSYGAEVFAPAPGCAPGRSALAADPTYRAIFFDMVHDILREMDAALAEFRDGSPDAQRTLTAHVDRLLHAAKQIGMYCWVDLLQEYPREKRIAASEAEDFVAKVRAQVELDAGATGLAISAGGGEEASSHPVYKFFVALPPLLANISSFGSLLVNGNLADTNGFTAAANEIASMAAALDFVRIADIAKRLAGERDFGQFRRLELRLYEELVAVEQVMPAQLCGHDFVPAAVLQNWCAEQAFDTLVELSRTVESMKHGGGTPAGCESVTELLRLIYYACRHYALETAAHLSMSLIDLFARARDDNAAPDPMLLRIASSFISDLELLFDTVGGGGIPDMAAIEELFEEAANVTFAASGTARSSVIEVRLGLPKSFRKVLTPESLKVAVTALEQGRRFYIVRAGLNNDETVAGRFLEWLESGAAEVISNVTVFEGAATLFDFLIATQLDEPHLSESLAVLDPMGTSLKIEMALSSSRKPEEGAREGRQGDAQAAGGTRGTGGESGADGVEIASRAASSQELMPRDILEGIGEIVTGQAMIFRTLGDLSAEDLVRTVEAEVMRAGGDWGKAKGAVRLALEGFAGRIEKVYQAEAQIGTQLGQLQEEAIAVRARPATLLTKPLEAYVEAAARQHGRRINLEVSGDGLVVDYDMLEELKPHLRALIGLCLARGEKPEGGRDGRGKLLLTLAKSEERVVATLDDPGLPMAAIEDEGSQGLIETARSALRSRGGELRAVEGSSGVHFEITLPMAMVVLDGMVVRVGEYRYVVPLEAIQRIVHSGFEDVMRLSAEESRFMLKLSNEEVLPVHCLRDAGIGGGMYASEAGEGQRYLFVVIGKQTHRVALLVDELMGQQLVLIRPLRGYLTGIRGVTGCALLGGGDVGMVLDIGNIVSMAA